MSIILQLKKKSFLLSIAYYCNTYCFLSVGASLVAQRLKHLLAMRETWVRSLGQEDPLEKEMATHSSILAWRIPWTVHGVAKSQTRLSDFTFTFFLWCFTQFPFLQSLPL